MMISKGMISKRALWAVLLAAVSCGAARAQETLKIAIGQRGGWEQCVSELGQNNGFFKKHGLVLDVLYTQGSAETLQSVISSKHRHRDRAWDPRHARRLLEGCAGARDRRLIHQRR
jgi:ABC-type nitrate/sulfonate/bicarbonate transport system substrate-binding protein